MLAAGADAFLGVGHAGPRRGAFAEKEGHELVHAGVREKQVGRGGQQRRRRDDGVALGLEEVEEALAEPGGSHERLLLHEVAAGAEKNLSAYALSCEIRRLEGEASGKALLPRNVSFGSG